MAVAGIAVLATVVALVLVAGGKDEDDPDLPSVNSLDGLQQRAVSNGWDGICTTNEGVDYTYLGGSGNCGNTIWHFFDNRAARIDFVKSGSYEFSSADPEPCSQSWPDTAAQTFQIVYGANWAIEVTDTDAAEYQRWVGGEIATLWDCVG